ncbi:MAG: hypothetical protein NTX64_07220, partial [Elusimicrobia bacterium]|nr:hypothetical protein [Elusimicrobiota bacterium]
GPAAGGPAAGGAPPRSPPAAPAAPKTPPPAPPLPLAAPGQDVSRNYFSRGYSAGMRRLADDAQIQVWHLTGQTSTIGDPLGKVGIAIHQEGPSCGVGAQYEAMRSRGMNVDMPSLAKEAIADGFYAEIKLRNGKRTGGTSNEDLNKLLATHGVKATYKPNATPRDLDAAVRGSGDAIVAVQTQKFWQDPKLPPHAGLLRQRHRDRRGGAVHPQRRLPAVVVGQGRPARHSEVRSCRPPARD